MVGKFVTAALFVALIGWDIWEAAGNIIGLPGFYEALSVGDDTPWFLLIPGVMIPVILLAAGLWWGVATCLCGGGRRDLRPRFGCPVQLGAVADCR